MTKKPSGVKLRFAC